MLGDRIKELRERQGMTQGDLMRAARQYIPEGKVLSRATLSRIENNEHIPTSWTLDAIASALGVRTDYLLQRTGQDTIPVPEPAITALVRRLNLLPAMVQEMISGVVGQMLDLAGYREFKTADPQLEEDLKQLYLILLDQSPAERARTLAVIRQGPERYAADHGLDWSGSDGVNQQAIG